jgi:hypothetical protein
MDEHDPFTRALRSARELGHELAAAARRSRTLARRLLERLDRRSPEEPELG